MNHGYFWLPPLTSNKPEQKPDKVIFLTRSGSSLEPQLTEFRTWRSFIRNVFKTRLADKNFHDRMEIYDPVASLSDVKFVLIVANKFNLKLEQFDIKTAFLNCSLLKVVVVADPSSPRSLSPSESYPSHSSKFYYQDFKRYLCCSRTSKI